MRGYERATGILPLVRVQSGRERSWLCTRSIAVGSIGSMAGLFLAGVACFPVPEDLGSSLPLSVLVIAYATLWTALLMAVALVVRNPQSAQDYRRGVAAAAADRMEPYIAASWNSESFDVEGFEQVHGPHRRASRRW